MREILFRGKRLDNGEWVEGSFCPKTSEGDIPCIIVYNGKMAGYWFEVDRTTVGQYTGLTDNNGKRIFEGDILRIRERGVVADGGFVVFENEYPGGWLVASPKTPSRCSLAMRTDVQVIGNIYDNPDLLGGSNG